jgi:hypothetical protein
MALWGALAENTRRNERVDRGLLIIPASANGVGTIGFTSTQTINLTPAYGSVGGMRYLTHFMLTVDDNGVVADGVTVTKPAVVTGNINAAGTILTVNLYAATSTSNPTLLQTGVGGRVRYMIWGSLSLGEAGTTANPSNP